VRPTTAVEAIAHLMTKHCINRVTVVGETDKEFKPWLL